MLTRYYIKGILFSQLPTIIICIFLTIIILFFNYKFYYFSDFSGHVTQNISSLIDIDDSLYGFKALLGYYPILYPPLTGALYWLLNLFLSNNQAWMGVFFLTLPFYNLSLYLICKYLRVSYFVFLFISLYCITTSFEHESKIIFTGSTPAFIGITIFLWIIFFYLKYSIKKSTILIFSLLNTILILSHTISTSVSCLFFIILLIQHALKKDLRNVLSIIIIGILSVIGGLIWIIPYLYLGGEILQFGLSGYSGQFYIFTFLFLTILLIWKVYSSSDHTFKQKVTPLIILIISCILISIFPHLKVFNELHQYRYFMYGLIIAIPIIFLNSNILDKSKITSIIITLLIITSISIELFKLKDNQYIVYKELPANLKLSGRVMDITIPGSNHTFYSYIINNYSISATNGLYKQSAPLQLINNKITNDYINFSNNELKYNDKTKYDEDFKKVSNELDLIGVNYFIIQESFLTEDEKNILENEKRIFEIGEVHYTYKPDIEKIFLVKRKNSNDILQILTDKPKLITSNEGRKIDIQNLRLNELYTYDEKINEFYANFESEDIATKTQIKDINVNKSYITFTLVNNSSNKSIPILFKSAYSPFLKAANLTENSNIPIIEISPSFNLMLVTEGKVLIEAYAPWYFIIAKYISVFTLIMLISLNIYFHYFKRKY